MLGTRAIVNFDGRWFSPVYGHWEWLPSKVGRASCAIGCSDVPSDRHYGCGFHAHFNIWNTIEFVRQISGMSDVIVLCEFSGKIVVHKKGLRAEYARIVAVSKFDPKDEFFFNSIDSYMKPYFIGAPLYYYASKYFNVPILTVDEIQKRLDAQTKTPQAHY